MLPSLSVKATLLLCFLPLPVFSEQVASARPDVAELVWQVLLGLTFVIFLILVVGWLTRRFLTVSGVSQHIKLLSVTSLGAREKLVLVQVGEQQVLLGVSTGSITRICDIDPPVEVISDKPLTPFSKKLSQALAKASKDV